jgi:hypothetical protein
MTSFHNWAFRRSDDRVYHTHLECPDLNRVPKVKMVDIPDMKEGTAGFQPCTWCRNKDRAATVEDRPKFY